MFLQLKKQTEFLRGKSVALLQLYNILGGIENP